METLHETKDACKSARARPSLRLFATYSEKTDEWGRGSDVYGQAQSIATQNIDEITFGFNVETWW
jgi:maltoporin